MIHVHGGAMSLILYKLSCHEYHIRRVYMLYTSFDSLAVIGFPVSLE